MLKLVLAFGSQELRASEAMEQARAAHPKAQVVGCTTAGEICGARVIKDALSVTVVDFAHTVIKTAETQLLDANDSADALPAICARKAWSMYW